MCLARYLYNDKADEVLTYEVRIVDLGKEFSVFKSVE